MHQRRCRYRARDEKPNKKIGGSGGERKLTPKVVSESLVLIDPLFSEQRKKTRKTPSAKPRMRAIELPSLVLAAKVVAGARARTIPTRTSFRAQVLLAHASSGAGSVRQNALRKHTTTAPKSAIFRSGLESRIPTDLLWLSPWPFLLRVPTIGAIRLSWSLIAVRGERVRSATERGEGRTITIAIDVAMLDGLITNHVAVRGSRPDCVPPASPLPSRNETWHVCMRKVYLPTANNSSREAIFSSVVAVC